MIHLLMPYIIKIISVLTFCILILHSQLHANEISNDLNNRNNKEISIFSSDQSKVKYATLAENNPEEKEYGEFKPDYKEETLEDFLQEHSGVAIAGTDFYRFPKSKRAHRKVRCLLRMMPKYTQVINANKGNERKGRQINTSMVSPSWNQDRKDDSSRFTSTNTQPAQYYFKATTSYILFPPLKDKPKILHPESLFLSTSECLINPKRLSIGKTTMKPNFSSDYFFNKGSKIIKPNMLSSTEFYQQAMFENKTKFFGDPLPGNYLFGTTTLKLKKNKKIHESYPKTSNKNIKLSFENRSNIVHNAERTADKNIPSMCDSLHNIDEWPTLKTFSEYSLRNMNAQSKLFTASTLSSYVSANESFREIDNKNTRNKVGYLIEKREEAQPKYQHEAIFESEKDYTRTHDKNRLDLYVSQLLKDKHRNRVTKQHFIDTRNSDFKISNNNKIMSETREFKLKNKEIGSNIDDMLQPTHSLYHGLLHPVTESLLMITLNKEPSPEKLNKRSVDEKYSYYGVNDLFRNLCDNYDYYLKIGDNNTNVSPFQNNYSAINVRTAKRFGEQLYLNNETAFGKLNKSKKLTTDETNLYFFSNKSNLSINTTIENVPTTSPYIIQTLGPDIGDKQKLGWKCGKNYIINLFRKKGNYSIGNEPISSTATQTEVRNLFFGKSDSYMNELGKIRENGFLDYFDAKDKLSRTKRNLMNFFNKMKSYSSLSSNSTLQSDNSDKSGRHLYKRNVLTLPSVDQLEQQKHENSTDESENESYYQKIKDIIELVQKVSRPKRKSKAKNKFFLSKVFHGRSLPSTKNLRRSVLKDDSEDYSLKFQNLQKDLLELQKALSYPKASHTIKSDEKNLTLQIRVIVDVVNNSITPNENAEEEQLKKRDAELSEKKDNTENIPMPLEHDSPLTGEKKGTDVWRNKRVDNTENELHKKILPTTERCQSSNSDLSDDIIRNITYLLDSLLENYKLQNRDKRKYTFEQSSQDSKGQKLKRSFIQRRKFPLLNLKINKQTMIDGLNLSKLFGTQNTAPLGSTVNMELLSALIKSNKNPEKLIRQDLYDKENRYSNYQGLKDTTQAENNSLLGEINKLVPSKMLALLSIRNRRAINNHDEQPLKFKDYKRKSLQDEINALYSIVENVKSKLDLHKTIDFVDEDNFSDNDIPFQTSEIPLENGELKENKMYLNVMKSSLDKSDAKFDKVLETIGNIQKELEHIKPIFKDKSENPTSLEENDLFHEILSPEIKNGLEEYKTRNNLKLSKKKNDVSILKNGSNKVGYGKAFRRSVTKKHKEKKTTTLKLPPCCVMCESTKSDDASHSHLDIEWCCPNEINIKDIPINNNNGSSESTGGLKTESSTMSSTTFSLNKVNLSEEESTTYSTQTTKNGESTSSTQTTKNGESTSSTQTTKNGESASSTQTTKNGESTSSAQTTRNGESTSSMSHTSSQMSNSEETTTPSTQTTNNEETTTSSTQTTNNEKTITSSTQTTENEESTTSSPTQTTSRQETKNYQVYEKYSNFSENLYWEKYRPPYVKEIISFMSSGNQPKDVDKRAVFRKTLFLNDIESRANGYKNS